MKPPPDGEWEAASEPTDMECVKEDRGGADVELEAAGGGGSDEDEAKASKCFEGGGTLAILNLRSAQSLRSRQPLVELTLKSMSKTWDWLSHAVGTNPYAASTS